MLGNIVGDIPLFLESGGIEARFLDILSLFLHLTLYPAGAVVVRHYQSVIRYKRSGASGYAKCREAHIVEPLFSSFETVFLFKILIWRELEGPHFACVVEAGFGGIFGSVNCEL